MSAAPTRPATGMPAVLLADQPAAVPDRTWLDAALAIPDKLVTLPRRDPDPGLTSHQLFLPRARPAATYPEPDQPIAYLLPAIEAINQPAKVRVYRTGQDPDDPDLGPCWHWRCAACRKQGNGCAHTILHEPGTWTAAMCGGTRHIHRKHPRPTAPGHAPHITRFGRRRCSIGTPSQAELAYARDILNSSPGTPTGPETRAFAREVLALAGYTR